MTERDDRLLTRRILLAVAALVLVVGPLSAQTTDRPPSAAAVQIGPLVLYPSVRIRDIGVDSNVFNEATDPKDDFSFTVAPQLETVLRVGVLQLTATSGADFVYYQTYKDEESSDMLLGGRIETVSTRLQPYVSAGRSRSRQRVGYEIDARALHVESNVRAGLDWEMTPVTALTGWVRREHLDYADGETFEGIELSDQLNRTSEAAAVGARFSITPLTMLVVAVELQRDRFANTGFLRDADSVRVAPEFQFDPAAAINGRVAVGYREFRPLNPALPRYRGLVASVGTTFTVVGMTEFDIEANRDVTYSLDASAPYYLASGVRVRVSQRIAGPFDIIGIGAWQGLRYQTLGEEQLSGRRETTTTTGGGVGFRLNENLRFAVTYDLSRRHSHEAGGREFVRRRLLGAVEYGR